MIDCTVEKTLEAVDSCWWVRLPCSARLVVRNLPLSASHWWVYAYDADRWLRALAVSPTSETPYDHRCRLTGRSSPTRAMGSADGPRRFRFMRKEIGYCRPR